MLKVGIVGATGYTGSELLRLLSGHPKIEITVVTSERQSGVSLKKAVPMLGVSVPDLVLQPCNVSEIAKKADFFFVALPHGTSIGVVAELIGGKKQVVDLGADYRFKNLGTYAKWYKEHTEPETAKLSVYGLPEFYRDKIKKAHLVGNPGCYPTSALLPLIPLLKEQVIKPEGIIIDAKSGASGAGKTPDQTLLFCEVNESVKAYKVAEHRHTPEIEEILSDQVGENFTVSFTPHLIPANRGILTTIYTTPTTQVTTAGVLDILKKQFAKEPFIKVLDEGELPSTAQVRGTNFCYIGAKLDSRTDKIILISAIDNLIKGASGAAVQNMNLMKGWDETLALISTPLYP